MKTTYNKIYLTVNKIILCDADFSYMWDFEGMKNDLAANLQRIIKDKGLTNRGVSLATGKSAQLVPDIISGKSKAPTIETLEALARVLDVSVAELMGQEPQIAPDLNILAACFEWVLDNLDKMKTLSSAQIVEELMRQYGRMLSDQIKDKKEAVRITRYIFESMTDKNRSK